MDCDLDAGGNVAIMYMTHGDDTATALQFLLNYMIGIQIEIIENSA
jgi:hypothetical protein